MAYEVHILKGTETSTSTDYTNYAILQVDISILEDHAASSFRVNPEDRKHFL
jgi:hypothetical protein